MGNINHDELIGYTYSGIQGLAIAEAELKNFIKEEKEKYPRYDISYTIINPKEIPRTTNDIDEKYFYSIEFTVTKGEKSSKVVVYVPYTYSESDHL